MLLVMQRVQYAKHLGVKKTHGGVGLEPTPFFVILFVKIIGGRENDLFKQQVYS